MKDYKTPIMSELEYKFEVDILEREKSQRLDADTKRELTAAGLMDDKGKLKLKGVSPKMLKRMKREYVACPVMDRDVQFIQCFICGNFQSRVTGQVLCKGDQLDDTSHAESNN